MLIVKDVIKDSIFGTIQNGKFVPIGKFNDIETFEDTSDKFDDGDSSIHFTNDRSHEFTCNVSKKSRKNFELLFIYGWRNKMPFRKRLLRKVINNRVERDWRRFVNGN